jgi:hypothetical protein
VEEGMKKLLFVIISVLLATSISAQYIEIEDNYIFGQWAETFRFEIVEGTGEAGATQERIITGRSGDDDSWRSWDFGDDHMLSTYSGEFYFGLIRYIKGEGEDLYVLPTLYCRNDAAKYNIRMDVMGEDFFIGYIEYNVKVGNTLKWVSIFSRIYPEE